LRRYDRLDYVREIVDIGKGFDAEEDVVERLLRGGRGIFSGRNDCSYRVSEWSRI